MTQPDGGRDAARQRFRAPEHERAQRLMAGHRAHELEVKTTIFRRAVLAAIGLFVLKVVAAIATNSLAILASSLDSLLDAAFSGLNWYSAVKAEEPPDPEHPFGHGKIESLVGGLQALILAVVALVIAYYAIGRVRSPQMVEGTALGVAAMLISALVALMLSRSIRRLAAGSESPILATEQLHYSLDFTTHAGVILALVLQRFTGIVYFDPFVSMLIALLVLWQVRAVVTGSVQDLVDRELPRPVQEEIVAVLNAHAGQVLAYHGLRTRRAGSQKIVSLHVVLCKAITFETSHHIVDHIELELESAIPRADVTIHADPCGEYCPGESTCPWARMLR
jgi:cation diffusion facilitator family transporter